MPNGAGDSWTKFNSVVTALSGLLIPIILLIVGHQYTSEEADSSSKQREIEQEATAAQHETDRVTLLLTHLSSTNPTEQKLALAFVEYLANSNQFPTEFLPIVINTLSDRDTTVVKATARVLAEIMRSRPAIRDSLVSTIMRRPDLKKIVQEGSPSTRALKSALNLNMRPDSVR